MGAQAAARSPHEYAEGKPLGKWTIPYLLRHTAYHALDHTWEMQDRDLTDDPAE